MLFPFDRIRKPQKKMMDFVKDCVEKGEACLIHAPTGIGKTAASISPCLEYAMRNKKKVVFLTPRHTQHRIAVETVKKINKKHNLNVKAISIIGKKWLCNVDGIDDLSSSEFNEYCRALKKDEQCIFYNNTWNKEGKLSKKAEEILSKIGTEICYPEEIKSICGEVCPYEIIMNAAKFAGVITADYFHIFHPKIREMFLNRCNAKLEDLIIIVDEAHNLPGRIRELMTSGISNYQIHMAIKEAENYADNEIIEALINFKKEIENYGEVYLKNKEECFFEKDVLVEMISKSIDYVEFYEALQEIGDEVREERKRSYLGSLGKFLEEWVDEDEGKTFVRIMKKSGRFVKICKYCLDPAEYIKDVEKSAHSLILMSGTLKPLDIFSYITGLKEAKKLELESNFPKENRLDLIIGDVTTQYTQRNKEMFFKIARYLIRIINATPQNVCVFFPSYEIKEKIESLIRFGVMKNIFSEKQDMSKEEKGMLFSEFVKQSINGNVLLGVIGGSFDQGVDFPNNIVKAVVIVGLPLDRPDLMTEAMIKHYERKFGKGWEYAYIYPAMIKVQQAAGRGIRSEKDKAVIIYMDKRYLWQNYRKYIRENGKILVTNEPEKLIKEFFNTNDKKDKERKECK